MSKARAAKADGVLPKNPKWVTIDASDGDPRRWPTNLDPVPNHEGIYNYQKPVELDDGLAIKWRCDIGQKLAEMLGYPDLGMPSPRAFFRKLA